MKISDLVREFEFQCLQGEYADRELTGAYCSDLLSDVMANAKAGNALVTIQAHKNTVAVASLVGIAAVILCNDRPLADDMTEAARSEGIALFRTGLSQFEVSGRLWAALHRADGER